MRKAVVLFALACAHICAFAASVAWTDFDATVVDKLVQECAASYKVKEFTKERGRVPIVILGEVRNNTGEYIDMSIFTARLQDALINSRGVLEFVAGREERQALREEKADQGYHASMESAKRIDNETAADFMLVGDLNLLKATDKKLSCQLVIQLCDIETNRIVFSSVKDVTIKGVKVKTATQSKQQKQQRQRNTQTRTNWDPSGSWDNYAVYSLAVPVVRRSFEGDEEDADCEFHATMVGFDKSTFRVHYPSHITLMTKYGIAAGFGGTMSADYGWGDEVELETINDVMIYGRYGAGFALNFGGIMIIPTAGIGVTLDVLWTTENEDSADEKDYRGCDATLDGFVNLVVALMFTARSGMFISLELSAPLCGAGSFTELESYTYGPTFETFSFMPTIGFSFDL